MSLVTTKEILKKAMNEKFAVGAFNIYNMETVQAVVEAANEVNSPVILQISPSAIKYAGLEYLLKLVEATTVLYPDVPIALHLDHGTDFDICKLCIDSGFTSVMIDGSSYDFEENIRITKQVVEYAHSKGVVVEAELGVLSGIEDEINVDITESLYTNPNEAYEFVKRTGCDSLAISIGTSHGAYKFKNDIKLRTDILQQIKELIPETPLVLHGASSVLPELVQICNQNGGDINEAKGVPDEVLIQISKLGISKINVDTDLRLAMTAAIRKTLTETPDLFDSRVYLYNSRALIKEIVRHKMSDVFCSSNKI